jgi:hypothetical protein
LGAWNSAEKFSAVVETASLNELELGEYCRGKGIFPDESSSQRISALRHNHMKEIGKSGKAAGRPTAYKALAVCLGK